MPGVDFRRTGTTLTEACIVVALAMIIMGIVFQISRTVDKGRAGVANDGITQAGFTALCEMLQRDLATPLAVAPQIASNLLQLSPSAVPGYHITYQLDGQCRAIIRTDTNGKAHAYACISGLRDKVSFEAELRTGQTGEAHVLVFRLIPQTEASHATLERVFPLRWQDLSHGFFHENEHFAGP